VEVVVFPDSYAKAVEYLKSDLPLMVTGTVDVGEKSTKIKAVDIVPLREMTERETRRVWFTLDTAGLERQQLESLKGLIGRYPGNCRPCLRLVIPGECSAVINLPDSYKVAASEDLSLEVEGLFGYNAVSFE
jgi:DNA polymerase-3 subunit alpha